MYVDREVIALLRSFRKSVSFTVTQFILGLNGVCNFVIVPRKT
jgi:hypothetical protein